MLTIGIISATGGRYYTDLARSDYYTSGGESPGKWYENEAARAFGFSGTVEKEQIERLFDGYHPKTGQALREITVTTTAVRRWISALACLKM